MKIALLHPFFLTRGGGERKILLITKYLQSKGHNVTIFCHKLDKKNSYPEYSKGLNFVVVPYKKNIVGKLSSILKLVSKLKTFDVVHAQNIPSYFEAGIAKYFYGMKTIWFCNDFPLHYDYYNKQKKTLGLLAKRFFEKRVIKKLDYIVTNSRDVQKAVKKDLQRDSILIYSGIDTDFFKAANNQTNKNGEIVLFSTGRLVKYKNFGFLINLFKDLGAKNKDKDLKLFIAGDGEERKSLELLSGDFLNKKIFFLGNVSQKSLVEYYNNCDIFLLGSKSEPLGVTPMEAMACEKPVIAFNSGGPKDVVESGKTGFLADTEEEFESFLIKLIKDNELREKLGKAGRKRAIELFSVDEMLKKTYVIYEGIKKEIMSNKK